MFSSSTGRPCFLRRERSKEVEYLDQGYVAGKPRGQDLRLILSEPQSHFSSRLVSIPNSDSWAPPHNY